MAYYKMLVELALKKAEKYEKEGNKAKAEYFLGLAEKAEEAYKKKTASDKELEKNT